MHQLTSSQDSEQVVPDGAQRLRRDELRLADRRFDPVLGKDRDRELGGERLRDRGLPCTRKPREDDQSRSTCSTVRPILT